MESSLSPATSLSSTQTTSATKVLRTPESAQFSKTTTLSKSLSEATKPMRTKSSLVSRNVTIAGHRTSVRLEPEMWNGLAEACRRECATMHEVCTVIASHKPTGTSLTAAIRVFVMAYYRAAATEDGHNRAGHGPGGHLMMSLSARSHEMKK